MAAVIIRYPNRSGALVTVTERDPRHETSSDRYTAECAGCLNTYADDYRGFPAPTRASIKDARDWASQHATECNALPQAEED